MLSITFVIPLNLFEIQYFNNHILVVPQPLRNEGHYRRATAAFLNSSSKGREEVMDYSFEV